MTVTGHTAGEFGGPITLSAVSHEIVAPRDPASGLPTGKRQHKPFTITKELDTSSPLLLHAFVSNESLPAVQIALMQGDQQVGSIKLTNASVASYDLHGQNETFSFTYEKIEWTVGTATASDDLGNSA
jgi:type VI secretion system secreted protein Hcp